MLGHREQQVAASVAKGQAGAEVSSLVVGIEDTDQLVQVVDEIVGRLEHVNHLFVFLVHCDDHLTGGRPDVLDLAEFLHVDLRLRAGILIDLVGRLAEDNACLEASQEVAADGFRDVNCRICTDDSAESNKNLQHI